MSAWTFLSGWQKRIRGEYSLSGENRLEAESGVASPWEELDTVQDMKGLDDI
jgi:hypothetical protein